MTDEVKTGPTNVDDEPLDVARLASLVDGRLSSEERVEQIRQLAASERDLDVFLSATDAVAHLNSAAHLIGHPENLGVPSAPKRRYIIGRGALLTVSLAAAAVLVVVVLTPFSNVHRPPNASQLADALSDHSTLPSDWNYSPWSVQRGSDVVSARDAHVRIGARAVDLAIAEKAQDTESIRRLASDIDGLLAYIPGGGPVGVPYKKLATASSASMFDEANVALRELPDQDLVSKGSWLEAARIAATRHDNRWFKTNLDLTMLRQNIAPADQAGILNVADELSSKSPRWDALSTYFTQQLSAY